MNTKEVLMTVAIVVATAAAVYQTIASIKFAWRQDLKKSADALICASITATLVAMVLWERM